MKFLFDCWMNHKVLRSMKFQLLSLFIQDYDRTVAIEEKILFFFFFHFGLWVRLFHDNLAINFFISNFVCIVHAIIPCTLIAYNYFLFLTIILNRIFFLSTEHRAKFANLPSQFVLTGSLNDSVMGLFLFQRLYRPCIIFLVQIRSCRSPKTCFYANSCEYQKKKQSNFDS